MLTALYIQYSLLMLFSIPKELYFHDYLSFFYTLNQVSHIFIRILIKKVFKIFLIIFNFPSNTTTSVFDLVGPKRINETSLISSSEKIFSPCRLIFNFIFSIWRSILRHQTKIDVNNGFNEILMHR